VEAHDREAGAGPAADSWFDSFLGDLESGRLDSRQALEARLAEVPPAMRRRAETLWRARGEAREGRGHPALALSGGETGDRYVEWREIGRGGMGVVYEAWDRTLERRVALKLLTPSRSGSRPSGRASERALRFLGEARLTARLDHPGIVPVHDLTEDAGRLCYSMRRVEGRTLRDVTALLGDGREGWNLRRAIGVLLQACQTVAYAHSRGVIHRDLKPSNIMAGPYGEVYVLDWGLARALDSAVPGARPDPAREEPPDGTEPPSAGLTLDGSVLGTPAFMAPEQARGESALLGAAADVYALGAILYSLLSGEDPYASGGSEPSREELIGRVIAGPPRPLLELSPAAPPELVSICERAMARRAGERYASALEMAEDLRAWLEHRVVGAHEHGFGAHLRKWVARNRIAAAALALLVAGALAAAGAIAVKERRQARELAAREELAWRHLYAARLFQAQAAIESSQPARARELLAGFLPASGRGELRCFAWNHLMRLVSSEVCSFDGMRGKVHALAVLEGGEALLGASASGGLAAWELAGGRLLAARSWEGAGIQWAALDRSGAGAAILHRAAERLPESEVLLVRLDGAPGRRSWVETGSIRLSGPGAVVALSPGASHLAASTYTARLLVFDIPAGAPVAELELPATVQAIAIAAGGRAVIKERSRGVSLVSFPGLDLIATSARGAGGFAEPSLSPDGEWLALPSDGSVLEIVPVAEAAGKAALELEGRVRVETAPLGGSPLFLAAGSLLAVPASNEIELREAERGERLRTLRGHAGRVSVLAPAGDERTIISGSAAGEVKLWDLGRPEEPQRHRDALGRYEGARAVRGGGAVILQRRPLVFERFEVEGIAGGTKWLGAPQVIDSGAPADTPWDLAPDGETLALGGAESRVRLARLDWRAAPPVLREVADVPLGAGAVTALAFDGTGARLVAAAGKEDLGILERDHAGAWSVRRTLAAGGGGEAPIELLALDPRGRLAAFARGKLPRVVVVELEGGSMRAILDGHGEWMLALAFSPDGRRLASGSRDGTAALWELPGGASRSLLAPARPAHLVRGHGDAVGAVAFLGRDLLATASDDLTVRLWDTMTGEERLTLKGHGHHVNALAVAADGKLLISAGGRKLQAGRRSSGRRGLDGSRNAAQFTQRRGKSRRGSTGRRP
jgi:WD40 repeat protein